MVSDRRVVVTGLGLVTCLGLELEENWKKLVEGVSGIGRPTLVDSKAATIQAVGEVNAYDWQRIQETFREDSLAEGERRTLFALWAARSALQDAQALDGDSNRYRHGVILAAGLGINRIEDINRWTDQTGKFDFFRFGREYENVHRESLVRNLSHRPAGLIAKKFGLRGTQTTVTSACAAATQAIGLAYRNIRRGDADLVVSGGADSMINPIGLVFFVLLKAASTTSENPKSLCRPFDRKRSGLVMGEGAGCVVLEELSHALNRGARIYAEVVGYGSSMDAYRVTAPHPQGRGAAQSMGMALKDAQMHYKEIDYINAHGTSTKPNDLVETVAIKTVFKEYAYRIPISSSKSMIGHLLAASGAPEFVYTVLSVQRDEIHPTINLRHPDPKCDLDYVSEVKRSRPVRAALSNSFGFGGQNASIIAKKYNAT
ncbi:MAG: beta-ketoacyl-[acyl-carrier-protein] synthase family protein [Nitrospirota bacterium]|nr:MAG: beta-ketoacyl-[acyl-carrier-protein] synthase family protein [Nitrospirota bacterium]